MAIARLALTDFRNHADALIAPDIATPTGTMVVLTGENGAGKTNILEAISLLAPGRGLRGAALVDMARQEAPAALLSLRGSATRRSGPAPTRRCLSGGRCASMGGRSQPPLWQGWSQSVG